jgi:hypothetical protein
MMRAALIRWGVVAATFASCAAAYGQDAAMTASVTKFASSYSNAVLKKDLQTVVASMYPAFRAHVGGVEKSTALYRDAPASVWPIAEKLGDTELCSVGGLEVALVRTNRTLKFLQGPIETDYTYVFVSSDKGKNWSVIDQGCTNDKTLSWVSAELANHSCGKKMVARFFPE